MLVQIMYTYSVRMFTTRDEIGIIIHIHVWAIWKVLNIRNKPE